jgi:catechol 2,3-dioxygenase-like lactoylglutathione lyase family enzyme
MFSHVTVGTTDLARAIEFYDAVLKPLGIERRPLRWDNWASWQRPGEVAVFWVGQPINKRPATWGNGCMVAFIAPSRPAVDAAHAAAMAAGGCDEGAPGLRTSYAPDYYGAYVRDPDGNKLHFVRRGD